MAPRFPAGGTGVVKPLLAAALLLPLAGLAANVAVNEAALGGATEWRIPVTGYDPRDPLRGQFIQFRYDWRVTGACAPGAGCDLCLEDEGRSVRIVAAGAACRHRIDLAASKIEHRPPPPDSAPVFASRLFVSEATAPTLDALLRRQRMVVAARLTRGGRLINERLEPAGD
jgi:GDYXXLXY protein